MFNWWKAKTLNKEISENKKDAAGLTVLARETEKVFSAKADADSSWQDFSNKLESEPEVSVNKIPIYASGIKSSLSGVPKKIAACMISLTMVISSLNYAAAGSLPGNFLYRYKLMENSTRLALTIGRLNRANELLRQSKERLAEAKREENRQKINYLLILIDRNLSLIKKIMQSLENKELVSFKPKYNNFVNEYQKFVQNLSKDDKQRVREIEEEEAEQEQNGMNESEKTRKEQQREDNQENTESSENDTIDQQKDDEHKKGNEDQIAKNLEDNDEEQQSENRINNHDKDEESKTSISETITAEREHQQEINDLTSNFLKR